METKYSSRTWSALYLIGWLFVVGIMLKCGSRYAWSSEIIVPMLGSLVWLAFISRMTWILACRVDSPTRQAVDVGMAKIRINVIFVASVLIILQFLFLLLVLKKH